MNRFYAALVLLAVSAMPARAQGIELSGGVNFATLSGEAIQEATMNAGLNFGLDVVLPVGPVGLNLGADWSQKGVQQTIDDAQSVLDISYLELPLHVRFPLVGAGPIRLNALLGPTLGINTGCKISIGEAEGEACEDIQGALDPANLDWAGTAGLGVSFHFGGLAYAGVDLGYTLGLSSLDEAANQTLKNRTFTLKSHIGFDIF